MKSRKIINDLLEQETAFHDSLSTPLDSDISISTLNAYVTKGWIEALRWVLDKKIVRSK